MRFGILQSLMRPVTLVLAMVLVVSMGIGCSSSDDSAPTTPTGPRTAAGYTERGWERFEAGDYDGALDDFDDAIERDATYGEAYAGQGWARLVLAVSTLAMQEAGTSFVAAISAGETGVYVQAGRAAASLGSGETSYSAAISQAQAALEADPAFVFSHRTSFTSVDLRLIEAFAQAGRGGFDAALVAADFVLDSGIDADASGSWQVDGTTYDTFIDAVMAHLHKVSGQFSG